MPPPSIVKVRVLSPPPSPVISTVLALPTSAAVIVISPDAETSPVALATGPVMALPAASRVNKPSAMLIELSARAIFPALPAVRVMVPVPEFTSWPLSVMVLSVVLTSKVVPSPPAVTTAPAATSTPPVVASISMLPPVAVTVVSISMVTASSFTLPEPVVMGWTFWISPALAMSSISPLTAAWTPGTPPKVPMFIIEPPALVMKMPPVFVAAARSVTPDVWMAPPPPIPVPAFNTSSPPAIVMVPAV